MTDPRPQLKAPWRRPAMWTVPALLVVALLGACNILAPAMYLLGGLPQVEAEYVIEPRTAVVFVDDRANVIPSNARVLRLAIADAVAETLMVNEVLTPDMMISPRDALGAAMARDRYSELLAIDEIGREVGAEQVIYIEMTAFRNSPDGATPRPIAACRVRVIDVANRTRLYPDPEGELMAREVTAVLPPVDPEAFRSASSRLAIHRVLAETTGLEIARLFFRHEPRDLGGRLKPQ